MSLREVLEQVQQDAAAAEAGDAVAHVRLLNGIHKLRLVAETPAEKTMRMRFQILQNLAIRVLLEHGVLQAIAARKRCSISAAALARELTVDELLIVRLMRLVTYVGVCDETGYATYASNETTEFITQKAFIGAEKHHTDLGFAVGSKLIEMVRAQGLLQFPGPGEKNPFEYTFGMPLFDFFGTEEGREQKEAFDDYMAARREKTAAQWFDVFPVKEHLQVDSKLDSDATLLVDVGGGSGHEAIKFRQALPCLPGRVVVQDLALTLSKINSKPEGIEFQEHDFFTEQPIKGARLYYLRNIMHDWDDNKCHLILSNIVPAMDKDYSRILIDDYVLPDTGVGARACSMDFLMLLYASGIERAESQWEALLSSAGLDIVRIWCTKTEGESVIEARRRT